MINSKKKNHCISNQTTLVLSRDDPTAAEFNNFYGKEDPWDIKESAAEIIRQKKINYEFRNCYFQSGLDIGCGEGYLTNSLSFVKKLTLLTYQT